jgi:hypothetical protein
VATACETGFAVSFPFIFLIAFVSLFDVNKYYFCQKAVQWSLGQSFDDRRASKVAVTEGKI